MSALQSQRSHTGENMKITTRHIWITILTLGGLLELYTLFNRRSDDTLSELVWDATDYTPLTPLAIGVVVGHWFWPRLIEKKN
jgi:hypothetical protein